MALYPLLRPLAFALDAERAHRWTIGTLKLLPAGHPPRPDPMLAVELAGMTFPNPVGLAAGFDKDAEVFRQMLGFGFGFVEVGTLTPRPQAGNPKPRLFRLAEDEAVINRMGFNNEGQEAAKARLLRPRYRLFRTTRQTIDKLQVRRPGVVGVNIGANKENAASDAAIADYVAGVRAMAPLAHYLAINISSPNTPGLRGLQNRSALDELLAAIVAARDWHRPLLFLKVAPDLDPQAVGDIAGVAMARGIDGLIVGNTTISRPALASRYRDETGGLSGAPLKPLALERLRDFRKATGGALPLVAAGGIGSGADAFERIKAGASLVQLYSALVYRGPGLAKAINRELKGLLAREGFATVAEAVGTAA